MKKVETILTNQEIENCLKNDVDKGIENINFSSDESLSEVEKIYDLVRRNENPDLIGDYIKTVDKNSLQINEILKNGDTLLCLCCHKNLKNLVQTLVEKFSADINLCRSLNVNFASFSTMTPTVAITARRQSRLVNNANSGKFPITKGNTFVS